MFNPAVFQIDKFFGIRWADVLVVDFRVYPKSFTAAQGSKSKSVPTLGGRLFCRQ